MMNNDKDFGSRDHFLFFSLYKLKERYGFLKKRKLSNWELEKNPCGIYSFPQGKEYKSKKKNMNAS